ncbi:uncharacterized protein LOC144633075 [Oculina patagonica]
MAANNLVYNSYGEKYEVPRVPVSSINELQRADHIAFHRHCGAFWHHAIVEDIDIESGEIHVIEYTNTAKEFVNDYCCPPTIKNMTIAKVVRTQCRFQDSGVFLMKHERCLDPDKVIRRAESKLGEGNYDPVTNNCEHFAMWCKTGNSSSDQVNKAKGMVVHEVKKEVLTQVAEAASKSGAYEIGKEFLTQTASDPNTRFLISWFLKVLDVMIQKSLHSSEKVLYAGLRTLLIELFTGQEVTKAGAGKMLKKVLIEMAYAAWQEAIKGVLTPEAGFYEILTQTTSKAAEQLLKTGVYGIEKYIFRQTFTNAGKSVVNTGSNSLDVFLAKMSGAALTESGQKAMETGAGEIEKYIFRHTFTNAGKSVVNTGSNSLDVFLAKMSGAALTESGQKATQDAVTQAVAKASEEIVKTGTLEATEEIVTQAASKVGEEIVKTGTREATEEIVTQAVSTAGEEVVKTGAREGSEEVLTQTASKSAAETGSSRVAGVVCSAVIEGISAAYDINCARKDMKKGTISKEEFKTAVKKRLITGTGNVGGSTVGSAIGQFLIPVPIVGGVVGGIVGGISGKIIGNVVANYLPL